MSSAYPLSLRQAAMVPSFGGAWRVFPSGEGREAEKRQSDNWPGREKLWVQLPLSFLHRALECSWHAREERQGQERELHSTTRSPILPQEAWGYIYSHAGCGLGKLNLLVPQPEVIPWGSLRIIRSIMPTSGFSTAVHGAHPQPWSWWLPQVW